MRSHMIDAFYGQQFHNAQCLQHRSEQMLLSGVSTRIVVYCLLTSKTTARIILARLLFTPDRCIHLQCSRNDLWEWRPLGILMKWKQVRFSCKWLSPFFMEGDLNRAMWVQNIGQLIPMPFLNKKPMSCYSSIIATQANMLGSVVSKLPGQNDREICTHYVDSNETMLDSCG